MSRCNQCGRESSHARHCPKAAPADALPDPTAVVFGLIANAINDGGTLIVTGPNSIIAPHERSYGATLEDSSGEISANAYGPTLGGTLVALLVEWTRLKDLEQHQAAHDAAADGRIG